MTNQDFSSIDVIRRENTKFLMQEKGLTRQEFAEQSGINYGLIGHYIGKNPTKRIGDEVAGKIEDFFGKPRYWLDNEHQKIIEDFERDEPARDVIQRLVTGANDRSELRSIPYLDAAAACGHDRINDDFPEVLGRYEISAEFLERLGLPPSGDGLILIDSEGDSMTPTIPSNTPLLVNTKEKDLSTLVTGKIYVFCADGSLLCKRIFKEINNTLTIKADNPDKTTYGDITVNREEFNEFHILGRVKFAFVEL